MHVVMFVVHLLMVLICMVETELFLLSMKLVLKCMFLEKLPLVLMRLVVVADRGYLWRPALTYSMAKLRGS